MNLKLVRFSSQQESTLGLLFTDEEFAAFTLEDEYREEKVPGETRIPAGGYRLALRTVGGFHARYSSRYPDMHKGMLWLRKVPGFRFVLIHTGNTERHTAGCILVGDSAISNAVDGFGSIGSSRQAYRRFYPGVAGAIEGGEEVQIEIVDQPF
jgi:hypothetical protein